MSKGCLLMAVCWFVAFGAAADPIPELVATQATASLTANGGIGMLDASGDMFSASAFAGNVTPSPGFVQPGSTLSAAELSFFLPSFGFGTGRFFSVGSATISGTLYDINLVPSFPPPGEVVALESVIVPSQPTTLAVPARITGEYPVFCRNAFPPGTPCPTTQIATLVLDLPGEESISFNAGPNSFNPIELGALRFASTPVPEAGSVGLVLVGAVALSIAMVRRRGMPRSRSGQHANLR